MRVEVTPTTIPLQRGAPAALTVTVSNPHDIIAGASIRVLGADPSWVQLSADRVSLFPGESHSIQIVLTPPEGLPAGARRVAVQVQELTPPEDVTITEVVLEVPAQEQLGMRVDPLLAQGGRSAAFGLIVENRGNTDLDAVLRGHDEEEQVSFEFRPPDVQLAPGEHAAVEVVAHARRRLTGNPVARMLTLHADTRTPEQLDSGAPLPDPLARATFLQRAWFGRGTLSLVGLLAAVTVFAAVITVAMAGLVTRSAADRNLALQVASARNASATVGSASVSGTVRLLTSRSPVPGISVQLFPASDTSAPLASTATDSTGAFSMTGLPAGSYKIRFIGAGFAEMWYPGALNPSDATPVTVSSGQQLSGLNVLLGGLPASLSGKVVGTDVSAATVTLTLPDTSAEPGAIITTVPVGADGSFSINNVPSPARYDLVVSKTGYASTRQPVDLGGGEKRTGIVLRLIRGDGLISGVVTGAGTPLGGATVKASTGSTVVTTVSLTTGNVGEFVLRGLPTPAQLTVVVSSPGYASQTLTVTLANAASVTGLRVDLGVSAGSLSGSAVTAKDGKPAGGVTVTVTNGATTLTTVTQSQGSAVGSWSLSGLPVPSTYSVTFSRPDLTSQTLSVSLDARGALSPGSGVTSTTAVNASLEPSTAVLRGTVTQQPTGATTVAAAQPVPEASVTLTNGTTTWKITTASLPTSALGTFVLAGLPPGTYTLSASLPGTQPTSQQVTLAAGDDTSVNLSLAPAAEITGTVTVGGQPAVNALVVLYTASQYPGVSVMQVQTDSTGHYVLSQVQAPENYVVEVQLPAGSPMATQTVTTQPSVTSTVDFTLPAVG